MVEPFANPPAPGSGPQYPYAAPLPAQYTFPSYPPGSAPPYGNPYGFRPDDRPAAPLSVPALILGILGLLTATIMPFLALGALAVGLVGRGKAKQAPPNTYREGMLTAGWVMGAVGIAIHVLMWLMIIVLMVVISATNTG